MKAKQQSNSSRSEALSLLLSETASAASSRLVYVQDIAPLAAKTVSRDLFFFSSRRRHTRWTGDWSSDGALPISTFGFTLEHGRGLGGGLNALNRFEPWGLKFAFDIFHTAQEAWDARFVSHSTRVRTVTV